MPGSGDDYKSQILGAIDIVQLIGATVALKRRGKDYVGLCPFHQEKTPSFHVSPSRQFFHCYGCKAGGNAIDFVMKRDRIEFIDALKMLGQQVGIEMHRFGVSSQKSAEKQVLLEMQSAACAFFERTLSHPDDGAAARAYLAERKISSESIKRFQIGLAPDAWDRLLRSRELQKFTPAQLALGGLIRPRPGGGGFYDVFRNRLMFPIRDDNGRIIAFGGRVIPGSEDPAKYLNSPETPLFSKSRCIFGIDLARQKMVESRTAVVGEGYTDVIVAHQFGIQNVVSVLGTAMTEQHVSFLRRFADKVVFLFDADLAGDKAANRAIELFLTQPIEIAIASMPPGVDPDEFLLEQGAEAFQAILDGSIDALSYKWKQLSRHFDQNGGDLTSQQKGLEAYLEVLARARGTGPVDPLRWGVVLSRVSRLTDIPVEDLNERFGTKRKTSVGSASAAMHVGTAPQAPPRAFSGRERAERWILGVLLIEPRRWQDAQKVLQPADFSDERCRAVAESYWHHQRDEGEPVFNEFLGALGNPHLVELAIEALNEVESIGQLQGDASAALEGLLADAVSHLHQQKRLRDEKKLVAALRRTSAGPGESDEVDLLRQLQEHSRRPDLRRV